ncbi:MAG: hypothetical protein CSA66_05530 [Proteobacteria bacterium]|nr:MAG: hypothetical protein CSA66_05530 [Pseudomonadota bacterium]
MSNHRVVLPRTRSVVAAVGATMAAAGVVALTVGLIGDSALPTDAQLLTGGVGLAFSAALLMIGFRLVSARGGLVVDLDGGRMGMGVTSERDTWWVPLPEVREIGVVPLARGEEPIERWTAALRLAGRAEVVLAESDDRSTIVLLARQLAERAGVPLDEDPDGEAPPVTAPAAPGVVEIAVRRRAALQGALAFFGASLLVVGAAMFASVDREPVFGFLFGPLMGLLGLALLLITVVKRFAVEELRYDGQRFCHRFRLGKLRWAGREITASRPTWRLFIHGLRGAHLELVGDDGTLVVASGATTRSRASLEEIARLPTRFAGAAEPARPAMDGARATR